MSTRSCLGQSTVAYLLLVAMLVAVLFAGPDAAVPSVLSTLGRYYAEFTQGVSRP